MWLVSVSTVPGNLPFRLDRGEFIVGRAKHAQIVIAEPTVSRRHACLVYARDSLTVEDLKSANGTFVNEVAVSLCQLQLGDHVRFGSTGCAIAPTPLFVGGNSDEESTDQIPLPKSSGDTTLTNVFTPAQIKIIPLLMDGKSERRSLHFSIKAVTRFMPTYGPSSTGWTCILGKN